MIKLPLSYVGRATIPTLLVALIPLNSNAREPAIDSLQPGIEAVTAEERLISAQTKSLRAAMLNQLDADKYWQELAEGLTLTQQQQAELQALQVLADDRFAPHLSGAELTESIRAVLVGEQDARLAARLTTPGREGAPRVAD